MKIENLSKEYKIKDGPPVLALKWVSFELPEKGMVFLLGKSGSGKTTLLNLLSGLDKPSGGKILFKGKDIAAFKPSEAGAFRNTYCGFVFQEYNVLPELTVGENIALALEMQGKTEKAEKVEAVLKEVELEGYEDRKADELSGGQKQRVAIARAIVKNPEILFADEPTGALDSATGEKIFSLLKKISAEKLVVVVTHDRDFAQKFGDRIIELADGKIIKDSDATAKDSAQTEPYQTVKPKISLKTAAKIGGRNLFKHPIRLAFTLLLTVMAFIMFGIPLDIAMWNPELDFIDAVYEHNVSISWIGKYERGEFSGNIFDKIFGIDSYWEEYLPMTDSDIQALKAHSTSPLIQLRERKFYDFQRQIFDFESQSYRSKLNELLNREDHYAVQGEGYLYLEEADAASLGYEIIGRLPQSAEEVAIPECLYNLFANFDGIGYRIEQPEDIFGCQIDLSEIGGYFTIVGVVDTGCTSECDLNNPPEHFFHEKFFVDQSLMADNKLYYYVTPENRQEFETFYHYIAEYRDGEAKLSIGNAVCSILSTNSDGIVAVVRNISLYLGVIFFAIGFIFLINFVKLSMQKQQRQIGILSAMGLNTGGLIKIYSILTGIICGITFILSAVAVFGLGFWVNALFYDDVGEIIILLRVCRFNILVPVAMLVALAVVALIGCVLPILRDRRKASVELINSGVMR